MGSSWGPGQVYISATGCIPSLLSPTGISGALMVLGSQQLLPLCLIPPHRPLRSRPFDQISV